MPKRKQRKLSRKSVSLEKIESPKKEQIEEVSAANAASEKKWHLMRGDDVLTAFDSSLEGISQGEAVARLKEHGPNVVGEAKPTSAAELFIGQFKSLLIIILIIALFISAALGEIFDAAVIFAIVILNALLGFSQEWKAEKALETLKKLVAPKAKVVRGGKTAIIDARQLVPGDVILLAEGDRVPADCRIIEQLNLKVDESVLTGESVPVVKSEKTLKKDAPVAEKANMVFAGTTVVYGHCKAVVTGTAAQTEFGKIAAELAVEEEPTPLQIKLNAFGKKLGEIIVVAVALIFLAGYFAGAEPLVMFLAAVALAVAAIPEGLPAVVTITLANGVRRMAANNAIVRKLSSVETLGETTVICADKTGTMTRNEMTVRRLYVDGKIINVTGEGYSTKGKFLYEGKELDITKLDDAKLLLGCGMLCNDSMTDAGILGDPTEAALVVAARKGGFGDLRKDYPRVDEIPFDSKRKMMSVAVIVGKKKVIYSKGAIEAILAKCSHILRNGQVQRLTNDDRERILSINRDFARDALRVLAFAVKKVAKDTPLTEEGLTFIGLQGMADPPRFEVKDAITKCKLAGINVVMITGDHLETATAVGRELGLISENDHAITGEQLDHMSDVQFESVVEKIKIYARVAPGHKVRITEALKKKGHIVAMTGDGINDAPALKRADVGIAMGATGTDVTREASDIILTDDNFATIVYAVEQGRGIFSNVNKFIKYMLSANLGEVLSIFAAMIFALVFQNVAFLLLMPVQILWMNLVTDGLPALALSVEPNEPGVMRRRPRDPREPILSGKTLHYVLGVAVMMATGAVGLFYLHDGSLAAAQTVAFTSLVFYQMAIAYSIRSNKPLWKAGWFGNPKLLLAIVSSVVLQLLIIFVPALNPIFKTVPFDAMQWAWIILSTLLLFGILEAGKVVSIHRKSKPKMKVVTEGFSE